jgi:hypothetical protein
VPQKQEADGRRRRQEQKADFPFLIYHLSFFIGDPPLSEMPNEK